MTLTIVFPSRLPAIVTKSQVTISEFIAALENPPANAISFAGKKEFVAGDKSEFMWLTGVAFEKVTFYRNAGHRC